MRKLVYAAGSFWREIELLAVLFFHTKKRCSAKGLVDDKPPGERLAYIKKIFEKVDGMLSDGRKYLTGDRLTIADIAFSAVAAPLLLPCEFGGAMAVIQAVPAEMRREVEELRATPAGQFVLLLYQDDRL